MTKTVNELEALQAIYHCINGPVSLGPVKVIYSRAQIDAVMCTLRQIMALHGFAFQDEIK